MPRTRTYHDAANRWAGIGPYYAMFPVEFANEVVHKHTRPGDMVLDPFAGRGTSVFSAAMSNRSSIGIEINPVGFVYAKAKLRAANKRHVERRLEEIGARAEDFEVSASYLPFFFHRCFSRKVRCFLLAARAELNWRQRKTDCTVMALLLTYLHGKAGAALSNQMRQTKSMSPQYAIRWWEKHNSEPPDIDPVEFMQSRLDWRYAKGVPEAQSGHIFLGDSLSKLGRLNKKVRDGKLSKANLLFTSPPYRGITNYHYDQWLRLWLLGGPPNALLNGNGRGGKFDGQARYRKLILRVFSQAAKILEEDATIYVRTDRRKFTYQTTLSVIRKVFPDKQIEQICSPIEQPSQTDLFGFTNSPTDSKGEVDLILKPA